jgi:group I intron endonuclease
VGVIYQIVIAGGSCTYVGSAHSLKYRQRGHLSLLRKGTHHCRALQNAIKKYGFDAISWVVLEEVEEREQLIAREQVWLDSLKGRLYNKSPTAGSRLGATMSASAKAKISASLKGNKYRSGIPHDDDARARISRAVRKALAEGRLTRNGDQFRRLHAEVAAGERANPWRRKPENVIKILAHLAETKSAVQTATHFEMNQENVRAILRIAEARLNEVFDQPSSRKKHQRGYFIHPDWFSYLEATT